MQSYDKSVGYEPTDDPKEEAVKPSELTIAQDILNEQISGLEHAIGRLGSKLQPLLSEETGKVLEQRDDGDNPRVGSSATVVRIQTQANRVQALTYLVNVLVRTLEV